MKKIMMLLMVSVFFLMGGMSMGFAQKTENESEIQVISSPTFIQVYLGQTARITFSLRGNDLDRRSYVISFWIRRPGQRPIELVRINKEGEILFRHSSASRITVSYNKYSKTGTVTISNVISEDEADYFVGVTESMGRWYWSYGTQLTFFYTWPYEYTPLLK